MPEYPETDKLTEVFTIKIPEVTHEMLAKLTPELRSKLNNEIRMCMARVIHESRFDPSLYLKTE